MAAAAAPDHTRRRRVSSLNETAPELEEEKDRDGKPSKYPAALDVVERITAGSGLSPPASTVYDIDLLYQLIPRPFNIVKRQVSRFLWAVPSLQIRPLVFDNHYQVWQNR